MRHVLNVHRCVLLGKNSGHKGVNSLQRKWVSGDAYHELLIQSL